MIGYLATKRIYKPYLIIPLFLYAYVMYRILEGTCNDANKKNGGKVGHSTNLISYQTNRNENLTTTLMKLAKEYQSIDRKRQFILNSLKQAVNAASDGKNVPNIPSSVFEQFYKSNVFERQTGLERQSQSIAQPTYTINCNNIHEIELKAKIGHGVSKQTFQAAYHGHPVAVKMVTRHQSEVKSCLEQVNSSSPDVLAQRTRCFVFSNMKLMKEILLLQQLQHPGFARLLGYCIRNEESDTTDLTERGIVSVYELGTRITVYSLQTLPWQDRLKHALELADFLHFLEFSPLGSLRIRDFKSDHFLMVNGTLKMIDLDDVDNLEPSCSVYVSIDAQAEMAKDGKSNGCEFNLPCQKGLCIGFNAKQNMLHMNRLLLKHLLFPVAFPKEIGTELGTLLADLDSNQITAAMLIHRLGIIQNLS